MSGATVPEGLEPLGVWDAGNMCEYGFLRTTVERAAWAARHLGDPQFIRRVEFHRLGIGDRAAPAAVVHRYACNADGFKYNSPDGKTVIVPPVIVPLAELPPEHLLRG